MIKFNKKIILGIIVILLLILPIGVFANNIIFPKVIEYKNNAREIELEKIKNANNDSIYKKESSKLEGLIENEEEIKKTEDLKKESLDRDNRVIKIVEKYAPKQMQEIYDELNGNSIYDTNIKLEYKFDNIILDIIEMQQLEKSEKEELIDYMYGEYGNVKDNIELYNRIEKVCK